MNKRRETPDVLGELLGEKQPAPEAPKETTEEKPTSKPARKPTRKPARQKASKPAPPPLPEEKVKATFYLSPEALDSLEEGQLRLRRLVDRDKRGQVSKSLIVEMALLAALEELEAKKDKSQLASMMAKQ